MLTVYLHIKDSPYKVKNTQNLLTAEPGLQGVAPGRGVMT